MKLIYTDLINLLSKKPSKELLSEKLFQLGHEHEIHADIFDMELTPNRGDCLSLLGLSRDLNIFFGKSEPIDIFKDNIEELEIDFENRSPSDCPQISFLEIEIDETTDSYKPYIENYFNKLGNKKTNIFTDISNFVSYELGQPTHCFDRETIKNKLIFENKECNNTFKTLLGSEVILKDSNCVFTIDGEIISLAGVMGGASTACSTKTRKVLVECAYFNSESIIGKSIKYNLTSDAAHKFERGVDIGSQEMVLRRFAKIVQDHAEIKSIKLKSFRSDNFQNISIPIDINKVNKILGTNLDESEYLGYLKDLGFNISNEIEVPSFRHDIKTNNDLAEEIARIIGYDNLKSSPIKLGKIDHNNESEVEKLESFLVANGFTEVINFPFSSKNEKNSINIINPLDSNRNNFRISLKDSLVKNLLYNERRQKDSIKLFEISDIYTKETEILQQKKLGLIISGRFGNNYRDFTKTLDNKYLNELLNEHLSEDIFEIIEIPRNELDTKRKEKIYYVEISLEDIPKNFFSKLTNHKKDINFVSYKPVSEYPSSMRDISFSITNPEMLESLQKLILEYKNDLLKEVFIFDYYLNDKVGEIKIGFRFVFQSSLKTITDNEINFVMNNIIDSALSIDSINIPGLMKDL